VQELSIGNRVYIKEGLFGPSIECRRIDNIRNEQFEVSIISATDSKRSLSKGVFYPNADPKFKNTMLFYSAQRVRRYKLNYVKP